MKRLRISHLSLRILLILLILLIFIPILAVLQLSGYRHHQHVLEHTEDNAQRLIQRFINEQRNIANQTHQLLKVIAQVPAVQNLDISNCNDFLKAIHKDNPQYSTMVAAGEDGIINCCAIPLKSPIDVNDRDWFKRINNSRDFVIDHFIVSRSANKASLPFAYPVFNESGKLQVVVGAAYNLEHYGTVFSNTDLPKDSRVIVADRKGKLLYQYPSKDSCFGKHLTGCAGIAIPKAEKGHFASAKGDGIERVYWYQKLSVGQKSNEILIMVGISKKVVFADAAEMQKTNIVTLFIVAMISLSLAWLFGNRFFLNPIQALLQKTERVKKGNLTSAIDQGEMPGELHHLSQAFDDMVEDLAQRERARNRAESTLREREERLRVLFDHAADAIFLSDAHGRLHQVNHQSSLSTGYPEEELLKMHVMDLDAELTSEESFSRFLKSFSPEQAITIESRQKRKDGSVFPVEITISQLETREGLRVLGISRDITERKKWQKQIQKTLSEKEILLQELYHRTKNNMQVIRSMLVLNASRYDNPQMDELVRNTENRIQVMSIVHQMLYKSSDLSQINLKDYITELVDALSKSYSSTRNQVSFDLNVESLLVLIDTAIPLGLVINELISNAYKHAFPESNKGIIQIQAFREEQSDIQLIVSDNGIGVPGHFDFQNQESLGLKMIRGIVEQQLDGTLRFESKNGLSCHIKITSSRYQKRI